MGSALAAEIEGGDAARSQIDRVALITDRTDGAACLIAIEAPTGFGKTVLAEQFGQTFAHQVHLNDLDGATLNGVDDQTCVVIDAAERFTEADVSQLATVTSAARNNGATVVVVGRRIPDALWRDAQVQLGPEELLLTASQIEPHLPASLSADQRSAAAEVLCEVTRGWIRAITVPLARIQSAVTDRRDADGGVDKAIASVVRRGTAQSHHLDAALERLLPEEVGLLRKVAALDGFDHEILRLLKAPEDFSQRACQAGLLSLRGGMHLHEVTRAMLSETSIPISDVDCKALADHLVERGDIMQAISVCVAFGDHEQAALTIAGLEHRHGFLVDVDDFNRSITLLPDASTRHPRVFLVQCWVNVIAVQVADAMRALGRAHDAIQIQDPDCTTLLHAEILAELAYYAFVGGDRDAGEKHLGELAAVDLEGSNSAAEARTLEAQASRAVLEPSAENFVLANHHLSAAIVIWRQRGEAARLTSALMRFALNVLEPMGQYRQAVGVLDEALMQPSLAAFDRARIEMFRSRILPMFGERAAAAEAVDNANRLAARLAIPWITGMTAWAEMRQAGFVGEEDAMREAFGAAEKQLGELLKHQTGAVFRCDAADAFARFGRLDEAENLVQEARAVAGGESFVTVAEIAVHARCGDAERALELIDTAGTVEPGMVWWVHALGSIALFRLGRTPESAVRLAAARTELDRLGQHDVLDVTERLQVEVLADVEVVVPPLDESTAAAANPDSAVPAQTHVRVFDRFGIEQNGEPMKRLPRGRSAILVKFLAVNEGRVVVDQAIDVLWPECDLSTGRQRLRNVLRRCRQALGPIIERDGESLMFADSVTSDFAEAMDLAEDASVRNPDSLDAADLAVAALSRPLLSDDRYADWAEFARADLERRRERIGDHQRRLAGQLGLNRPS